MKDHAEEKEETESLSSYQRGQLSLQEWYEKERKEADAAAGTTPDEPTMPETSDLLGLNSPAGLHSIRQRMPKYQNCRTSGPQHRLSGLRLMKRQIPDIFHIP